MPWVHEPCLSPPPAPSFSLPTSVLLCVFVYEFTHEMLVSLNTPHYPHLSPLPSPYPKTLLKPSHQPLFPIPNSLFLRTYRSKVLIRSSIPDSNTQTHKQPKTLPPLAIQRIADKLRSLGFSEDNKTEGPLPENEKETNAAGEIFIPLPHLLPKYRVGHTLDPSWSTPENPVPRPGSGNAIVRYYELSEEMERETKEEAMRQGKARVPTLAELTLSSAELRRLRRIGFQENRKLKVGKAGITEGIVNGIHERWRRAEVVKIVCEDLCRINTKRTHDLLERKTGGLVVWRSGTKIILYRGANYKYPYFLVNNSSAEETASDVVENSDVDYGGSDCVESVGLSAANNMVRPTLIQGIGFPNRARFQLPGEAQLAEEADRLLDGLGPRFTDWWGYDPLPVDADLLPAVVPGYRQPFRLLPYGIKPQLTDDEMTTLKRLGRPLPCHFALGRNRKHQGLAAAIVKLWEKCEIAKIAVKRGVQNTNSKLMAEELKRLTGGTLLSRDREYFALYRGKDFLPSAVSSAIEERRKQCLYGNNQRIDNSFLSEAAEDVEGSFDGTNDQSSDLSEQRRLRSTEAAIKRTSKKLSLALEKKAEAEKLLGELVNAEMHQQPELDKEGITEEERYMLRKVGLKMKPFLLTGRRGVFDGTIENMHLHWKYRELVKVICKERSMESINRVAQTLEAESGGILVAVERVSKGYAIIVYRGKNYKRPDFLRPRTLLNKREAMKRSLEAQRQESLKLHVLKLSKNIDHLRLQLAKDKEADNMQPFVESKFQIEEEMKIVESTANVASDFEPESDRSPHSIVADREARDKCEADSSSPDLLHGLESPMYGGQLSQPASQLDVSSTFDGNEATLNELESSSELANKQTPESFSTVKIVRNLNSASYPVHSMSDERFSSSFANSEHALSNYEGTRSIASSARSMPRESVSRVEDEKKEMLSTVRLSNKDRLLLRKQALNMKKCPLFAVGKNNIVTGVAKAIQEHFKRHPLAIVNIKGRAEGTSVQEVVFQLEQATGSVLVSQEPSKVILYRGWGAELEPVNQRKKNAPDVRRTSVTRECGTQRAVSPELMAAIRLECGLLQNQDERSIA